MDGVGTIAGVTGGVFGAILVVIVCLGYIRRRRIRQANITLINQQQHNGNNQYFYYPQGQFQGDYGPRYPPQTPYGQQSPYARPGYDGRQSYVPPPGPPPQTYVPGSPAAPDHYVPPVGPSSTGKGNDLSAA